MDFAQLNPTPLVLNIIWFATALQFWCLFLAWPLCTSSVVQLVVASSFNAFVPFCSVCPVVAILVRLSMRVPCPWQISGFGVFQVFWLMTRCVHVSCSLQERRPSRRGSWTRTSTRKTAQPEVRCCCCCSSVPAGANMSLASWVSNILSTLPTLFYCALSGV